MEDLKQTLLKSTVAKAWERIGIAPHHGINLPLSALRTKNSAGIGEFFDLIPLIDWCHELHLDVIQLLPLNDSGNDPSPYNALSSLALNPMFLSLHELPEISPDLKDKLADLQKLCAGSKIPYLEVQSHKLNWLHAYFEKNGIALIKEKGYVDYIAQNSWTESYALFKVLKNKMNLNPFSTWPAEIKEPSKKQYLELVEKHWAEMTFYIFLQYLCHEQFEHVKQYASAHAVLLKGDIPILLSPDSADVWHIPEIFDLTLSAGSPPDAYSQEGQYWGFPIYKWDILKEEHFDWWRHRLRYASEFYDIYRIDHVVGFFRIWAISIGRTPREGKFVPNDQSEWIPHGKELLEMMSMATSMLPIAEDLGTVPDEVRACLKEMGICGTKVMRWERMWKEDKRFIPIQYYPPISMTTVSTQDSETLYLWWRDKPEEAKAYADYKHWNYSPELSLSQRKEILWESHHTSSLFHINLLQEYLALFPELTWPDPQDERINIPGKVLPNNWTYRFRPFVEEFISHQGLKEVMQKIIFSPDPLSI